MQFHQRVKGSLGEKEDWWHLNEVDGEQVITHSWHHTEIRGLNSREGSNRYTVEEFLAGDHNTQAQAKLKEVLAKGD